MKFTEKSKGVSFGRVLDIEDGPIHTQAHSPTGRQFRVDQISVNYHLTKGGAWVVRVPYGVRLTGTSLKKDGTPGANRHNRHPETVDWRTNDLAEEYAWVQIVIDSLRPVGVPEGPVSLRELEV